MKVRFAPFSASFIVAALIIVLAAVVLVWMGRTPFCQCGETRLWSGDIWSDQNSQQFADPYTVTHVLHGTLLYGLLWLIVGGRTNIETRRIVAVALESAWELFENTDFVINRYREATLALNYYGDSVFNSVGDILAMAVGFELARLLPVRVTILGTILVDLALLLLIRDSLLLNIVMLLYPLESIKQWQLP